MTETTKRRRSEKIGGDWQGVTRARRCSHTVAFNHSLTSLEAQGLIFKFSGEKGAERPILLKKARSFPTILSIVPAARRVGQLQSKTPFKPMFGQATL